MPQETERKFLVTSNEYKKEAIAHTHIIQGYLSSIPERTVRIRIKGETGYITIKGMGSSTGATRYEWEKEIPVADAKELLRLCEPGIIAKIRYEVGAGKYIFEVDEFLGDNQGLVIAEIELPHEAYHFEKPRWLGAEVTGIEKYYNSMLMKRPYAVWQI